MLWYCHKRGREVRMEKEKAEGGIDEADRVEELPDDPALPESNPETTRFADASDPAAADADAPSTDLPPPPIGAHAPKNSDRP